MSLSLGSPDWQLNVLLAPGCVLPCALDFFWISIEFVSEPMSVAGSVSWCSLFSTFRQVYPSEERCLLSTSTLLLSHSSPVSDCFQSTVSTTSRLLYTLQPWYGSPTIVNGIAMTFSDSLGTFGALWSVAVTLSGGASDSQHHLCFNLQITLEYHC